MPQKPIYEAEPLPNEDGAKTTGLPHSAYQRARIRALKQSAEEPTIPAYSPKETVSDSAVTEGVMAARATAGAVRNHIRKQVLNARQPGLGSFVGPLPKKVQGVVDAAAEPLVRQVVQYTMKKYREGTAFGSTPEPATGPKPRAADPRLDNDTRTAEPETLTTHSWDAEESRYKSKTVPNPKFNAIAQDISSTHEKMAAKSPTAHPEEINRSLRQYVDNKYGAQTTDAHSARIENHRADNYNDPKRFDAIASRLAGFTGNKTGTTNSGHQFLSLGVGSARAPHGLFKGSSNDSFPTIFHKIRGNWQNVTHQVLARRGATVFADPEDREGEAEPDTQMDVAPVKKKRSSSDPALTAAARIVAKQHWSGTDAGKVAGQVKNELTGELHPKFEQTTHFKNPKAYIKKHFGQNDVDGFLLTQHSDLVKAHDAGDSSLPDLTRGDGKRQQVPAAPTATFARDYAVNPLRTTFAVKEADLPMESTERKQTRAERNNAAFRGEA
jgi:hypothetical protein